MKKRGIKADERSSGKVTWLWADDDSLNSTLDWRPRRAIPSNKTFLSSDSRIFSRSSFDVQHICDFNKFCGRRIDDNRQINFQLFTFHYCVERGLRVFHFIVKRLNGKETLGRRSQ